MKLYSIKDKLTDEFASPFSAKNDLVAQRMVREMFKNIPPSDDYELYAVGEFCEDVGKIRIADDKTGLYPVLISNSTLWKIVEKGVNNE